MSIQLFTTESLDLAAYLVLLGYHLNILSPAFGTRALFEFPESSDLLMAIVGYERGNDGAKRLLNIRSRLYREASLVARSGGGQWEKK
jgi:hypothetical protein